MMKQYYRVKQEYPDCIVMFRLGDFYEMFQEDAQLAARELDLTLTTRDRNKAKEDQIPMCGVPYHSVQAYISRLMAKGFKVALCDQMEDPATAKGLVDRQVTRVITPGTVIDETMLDEGRNNFICAIAKSGEMWGLCFSDITTGETYATTFDADGGAEHLYNELGRFSPKEALINRAAWQHEKMRAFLEERLGCVCQAAEMGADKATLSKQFKEGLENLPEGCEALLAAAGAVVRYAADTQKSALLHLTTLNYYTAGQFMELDITARRNLELTETLRNKEKRGSLLWVLDKTRTAMGSRLLRRWMEHPLLSADAINERLDGVAALLAAPVQRGELTILLREITDLQRLIGRVVYGTAGGRDLQALSQGLGKLPLLREQLSEIPGAQVLNDLFSQLYDLPDLREKLDAAICDEPPAAVKEGGIIRAGYHKDVDELRDILENGKGVVVQMEQREREKTGIKSLKVGYNKVFGYYLEVSKSYYSLVPDTYIRKQTLANCERYVTQELKDMEHTILSAKDRLIALEYELFCTLREMTAERVTEIQYAAAAVAKLDVLVNFANVAEEQEFCRPTVDAGAEIAIKGGRHPVVERMLKDAVFVPNDTLMDGGDNLCAIITGPNMAGKSTYMRQVALIVLMAQMGCFVPAKSAHVGVVDRIFTRVGASDDLAAGQSTFMVEMSEVAELLKGATSRSLLILDEIGRGTSTYDGMSIARAVLEHCAGVIGAKTLFATHYHELTELENTLQGVKNYNIAARKRQDGVVFLRKIVPGGADQSYGVEVAKLAGVPDAVIVRARAILEELEQGQPAPVARMPRAVAVTGKTERAVLEELKNTEVEALSPIEALNFLYSARQRLLTAPEEDEEQEILM
ncbi:MAG: DNA mismatch repair protein MutS [Oscillospiraceae bacterium]|nr:DNA mismatch repair protein MutS [Oscillospiraceae bacterium]